MRVALGAAIALASGILSVSPARRALSLSAAAATNLQTLADAFISADDQAHTWTIGNSGVHVTFGFTNAQDFVLEQIMNPVTGHVLNSLGAPDSTLTINGVTAPLGAAAAGWSFDGATTSQSGGGVQIVFAFRSSSTPARALRSYACYPGSPTIEAWTTVQQSGVGSVTVSNPNVWQFTVPANTVHYVRGLRGDSADVDVNTAFAIQTNTLNAGDQVNLGAQGRSTEQFVPAITADATDEFFGGLMWTGSWQIVVRGLGSQVNITAGLPTMDITVDSTHPLEAPHGFFGITAGGSSNVSQALRGFIDQGLRQGRSFQPLVTYNTWFAYGTTVDEQSMEAEMLAAASMGVELFVMDAGWYPGTGVNGPSDFTPGLGNWTADPARFPSGLPALAAYAHNLGLKFGLWIEPERSDLQYVGQPGFAKEAWLATTNGTYDGNPTNQQISPLICLSVPDAQTWIFNQLTALLDAVQPDYLKWDNNFWINCTRSGHGHGATDGNHAHVQGLYSVLAALRSRYPAMIIENVASGGNRLDMGMLRYTDTAWMDDRTSPSAHVRHNLQGLTTFFPPAYLLSFVNNDDVESLVNPPDLQLYTRSRMPGILGLNYRAADLSDADRQGLSQEIDLYETTLRGLVTTASAVLLTPQAQSGTVPAWDSLEEIDPNSGNVIIFAYQNDPGVARVTVQPTGLVSDATYFVTTADGTGLGTAMGADLIADGIEIDSSPVSAAHVLLLQPQTAGEQKAFKPQSASLGLCEHLPCADIMSVHKALGVSVPVSQGADQRHRLAPGALTALSRFIEKWHSDRRSSARSGVSSHRYRVSIPAKSTTRMVVSGPPRQPIPSSGPSR